MDPNNKELITEDGLNESTISTFSSIEEKEAKQMAKKIQKFEVNLKKKNYNENFNH